ncbi:MAG: hypothetical protein NVS3B20_19930 [Polyangiales bacterium]
MDVIVATSSFLPSPGISQWGSSQGEAAHVALGIAKGLRALGHRTTLVSPLDAHAAHAGLGLARRLSPLTFDIGTTSHQRMLHDARLPSGIDLVLLGGEVPSEATSAQDQSQRLAWFGHAVAALARQRLGVVAPRAETPSESELEAVIAVGEGAAFSAFAIREDAKVPSRDGGPSPRLLAGLSRIVIPLQPAVDLRLPRSSLSDIGVVESLFTPEGIEFYGEASLAKAGFIAADRVVALGDAPREALIAPQAHHRFDGVFRARGADLVSIGSGVDQAQYNPATDPHVSARFDPEDLSGKARGKASLLTELELDPQTELPLLVLLGLEPPKEAHLASVLAKVLRGEIMVIAAFASAPSAIESALQRLAKTHPGRVAIRFGATEPALHRVLAAADFALVIDPDGASATAARAAMRYGTVAVALRSPAVEEAVVDVDASLTTGTGFLFQSTSESDVYGAIQRAISGFALPAFRKLRYRVMRVEGGWERAARRLQQLIAQLEG